MLLCSQSILFYSLLLAASCLAQQTDIQVRPTLPTLSDEQRRRVSVPPASKNSSICYRYVGCFNNYPPFDNSGGVLPSPPERVGTVFLLYTPKNKIVAQQLDYKDLGKTLKSSNFNPLFPTKFVIHGFAQSEREIWLHDMKDALLTTGPLNVVVVGWKEGATLPDYPRAVANTRVVAKQIQMLVELMVKRGTQLTRVHLIGHSLGAHISGYVGAAFNGRIGRISGMDPAGPFYEGADDRVRLNPSDAKFIDVLHSNGKPLSEGGAGLFAPSGHVDFYPNGGKNQPGCGNAIGGSLGQILTFDFDGAADVASCSHARSHILYIESIKPAQDGCTFLSHPCSSWDDFSKGKCRTCGDHGCSEMGYHSIEYAGRGNYYLATKASKSADDYENQKYCGIMYDVTISPIANQDNVKGSIKLTIIGSKSSITTSFQGTKDELNGETKIIIVDYEPLGDLTSITLTYKHYSGSFFGWGSGVEEWDVDHLIVGHENERFRFCSDSSKTVMTDKPMKFSLC